METRHSPRAKPRPRVGGAGEARRTAVRPSAQQSLGEAARLAATATQSKGMLTAAAPELKELASAFSVTTEAARVHLRGRIPYELLDALQPKRAEASPPTGTR